MDPDYLSYLRHSYVQQGLYAQMLKRYLNYFSLDNFLFVFFEDEFLCKPRLSNSEDTLEFLELDSNVLLDLDIRSNVASRERSKILKRILKKHGWWRMCLKNIIPSLKIRQIIKNNIQKSK